MRVPRSLRRAASGRWRLAVLIAVAVVVPGGVGAGTMAMMPTEADPSSVQGLNGRLAFQDDEALEPYVEADMLAAVPVGADPVSEPVRAVLSSTQVIDSLGQSGLPSVAVDAYVRAADRLAIEDPACGIRWTLLAAIGRVESNHGRFGGAMLRDDGYPTKPIRGIPLDGRPNVALIRDTDRGLLDGDTAYDRAVGPMQFIPSTWRSVGVDGNGDGRRDPNNLFDAAYGAARYLCDGDADLRNADARARAVRRYNNADEYVRVVLNLADMYETGAVARLPAIGLPPMEPSPPPRPSPGPDSPPDGPVGPPRPSGPSAPAPQPAPPRPVAPAPNPSPPATPPPAPSPPAPTTTPSTPAPSPPTTAPPPPPATSPPATTPPPATSSTTSPPTTAPEPTPSTTTTTVPADPPAEPPATPEEPPAAVGWAPAMREVVVGILEDAAAGPAPAAPAEPPAPPPEAPLEPSEPAEPATPPAPPAPPAAPAPEAPPESSEPAEPPS